MNCKDCIAVQNTYDCSYRHNGECSLEVIPANEKRFQDGIKAGQDEALETSKTGKLLDALKLIRRAIRNSGTAPNVIDTIDYIAMKAIHDFFEVTK